MGERFRSHVKFSFSRSEKFRRHRKDRSEERSFVCFAIKQKMPDDDIGQMRFKHEVLLRSKIARIDG